MELNNRYNILVTGAAGFIGSVLCKRLKELGYFVIANDIVPIEHKYYDRNHSPFTFESSALVFKDIDVVCHLAARSHLGPSVNFPYTYFLENSFRTFEFLNYIPNIIFSSTAAVYGNSPTICVEDQPLNPINPYGMSKLHAEHYIRAYAHEHNFNAMIFRYFNVAGAYGDVGQKRSEPHLMTSICRAIHENKPITINGTNYKTPDGTCVRDYIHVLDVVEAHIIAINNILDRHGFDEMVHTYNLGTNMGSSIIDIVKMFDTDYEIGAPRPGDPDYLVANGKKFAENFGFEYPNSSLENIIRTHREYFFNE